MACIMSNGTLIQ